MKRSEWEALVRNGNGRHIGNKSVLGYPIYAISDDKGYHKNRGTLPIYVCEITEDDTPSTNKNGIAIDKYPMYICVPTKLMYSGRGMDLLDIQMIALVAIDCHIRGITAPLNDTMRLVERWAGPHNKGQSMEITMHEYLRRLNEE